MQNLQQIEELRQQLLAHVTSFCRSLSLTHRYLIDSSFVEASPQERQAISQARFSRGVRTRFVSVPSSLNVNADNAQILGGALASGLYPKILSLEGGVVKTIINQQPVAIVSHIDETSLTAAPQFH
jgi:ATP-dependent RNA helicase DHX29